MSSSGPSLESRHDVERRFHDDRAGYQADDYDFYAYGGMDLILEAYRQAIGDLHGKTVLDFGCGTAPARSIMPDEERRSMPSTFLPKTSERWLKNQRKLVLPNGSIHPSCRPSR